MGEGWGGDAMKDIMMTQGSNGLLHVSFNASPLPQPLPTEGRGVLYDTHDGFDRTLPRLFSSCIDRREFFECAQESHS
jgi:hypothetical protein